MFKLVVLLFVVPFVSCTFRGLNIQRGKCPTIQGAINFNPARFQGIWTVSQRSDDFFAHGKDCETQSYLFDGNNFHVFVVFSNPDSEKGKAYQAVTVNKGVGTLGFARSLLSDNHLLKGTQTIVATDNTSFAVTLSCSEILSYRIITIAVLIKGVNAPVNLDQIVNRALANNHLALDPPLTFRDLEARCRI